MSLKLILSLAFLAVCSATTFHGYDNYHVNLGVGHIIVSNNVGQQVHILINRLSDVDSHLIQIQVTGHGQLLDTEQVVNEPVTLSGQYQADILYQVFTSFNGPLDEIQYQKLINIIAQHVQEGHVHPAVLYAIQLLAQEHHKIELLSPYHHQVYNTIQGMFHNIGYNHVAPYSGLGSWYGYGAHQGYGLGHQGYGWAHQGYGLGNQGYGLGHYGKWYGLGSYPEVYGQDWARQSYYGPYSTNLYNTVGAGYGHHYVPHHVGTWAHLQGGIPYAQQHNLLAY